MAFLVTSTSSNFITREPAGFVVTKPHVGREGEPHDTGRRALAAAQRLSPVPHERFAPIFGKEQAQDHAYDYDYVKGLMTCPDRKSIENQSPSSWATAMSPASAEVRQLRPLAVRRRPGCQFR